MGVKGLQEFLETEPSLKVGVSTVDLVRSSWAREGKVTSCDKLLNGWDKTHVLKGWRAPWPTCSCPRCRGRPWSPVWRLLQRLELRWAVEPHARVPLRLLSVSPAGKHTCGCLYWWHMRAKSKARVDSCSVESQAECEAGAETCCKARNSTSKSLVSHLSLSSRLTCITR